MVSDRYGSAVLNTGVLCSHPAEHTNIADFNQVSGYTIYRVYLIRLP